nr:WW domain-binding protein 11-like [Ipomoea batatas]
MAAARAFLFLCLSLLLVQSFGRENFVRVSSENHGRAEHPEWLVFWHQHPPLPSWLPKTKWPFPHPPLPSWIPKTKFPHPPLPSWIPKTKFPHPPLPSWIPKTKWPFPHPPLPSWLPKTKFPHPPLPSWLPKSKFPHPPLPSWIPKTKFPHPPLPSWLPKSKFPHPPLPSWLPKTKWPAFPHPPLPSWLPKTKWPAFPHPPLPSWVPKNKWHFPTLPSGGSKWPWLPHHSTETKCPSTPAVIESCMKEGFSSSHINGGYKFSTECCKSVAEIKDECSDELINNESINGDDDYYSSDDDYYYSSDDDYSDGDDDSNDEWVSLKSGYVSQDNFEQSGGYILKKPLEDTGPGVLGQMVAELGGR